MVIGIIGMGGVGKSLFMDELVRRFIEYISDIYVVVLFVDLIK